MQISGRRLRASGRGLCAAVLAGAWLAGSAARGAGEDPAASAVTNAVTATNGTVITARAMVFDYPARTMTFEGNVVVWDPQLRMEADQMVAVLDARGEVETVTATGHVRIDQAERTAFCRQVVYTVPSGLMVLTGEPRIVRGTTVLTGKRFRFKRDENLVEGDDVRLQIAPGSTSMKDMLKP